ncbi:MULTISPECIES: nitrilase family protein [Methylobacterium]|uniref:nitrilase family protein n=1 Tax=Methylobacterium TaxID=407 RepID=UPI000367DF0D|nr:MULTISPECIES: nitrilase family protein [Methylobacterium]MBN4097639.1 nitrilase family protein [Methylobacterium sp. OT2]UIN35379.1 nitrilase family protein [Methylobacterium oryzae]SEG68731.1 Predicted amidohydrolase [Methylobacterium sp. 190mf]SEI09629.1 Predicted amidohydrolase [Methylobacterium sp. 275MFSha3.1]
MVQANDPARPPIRVSCIQFEPEFGAVDANMARASDLVRAAAAEGGRLIVLPELASTGYVFESAAEAAALAEPVPDGPTTRAWAALAAELGVHIVAGIAESAGETLYNAAVIVGPEGYIGTYRKAHLWDQENVFFARGDLGFPVFDTALGKVGVAICYDGWFPETFRQLALAGAEIVCIPTNWVPMPDQPDGEAAMANTLHRAAAHSNGIFIACADRVGVERGQPFEGQSLIIGPKGWPLAGPASRDRTETVSALVDLDAAGRKDLNAFNSLLRDRRADIYG